MGNDERLWPGLTEKKWILRPGGYRWSRAMWVENDEPRMLEPDEEYYRDYPNPVFMYVKFCPRCGSEEIKAEESKPDEPPSQCGSCNIADIFDKHREEIREEKEKMKKEREQ